MSKDYKNFNLVKNMVHQPPMLMVDEIVYEQSDNGETIFIVKDDCIFLDGDGKLLRSALIEIAAQSLAAVDIFQKKEQNLKHSNAFLAAVRDFVFYKDAVIGDEILCIMEKTDELEKLHIASATLINKKSRNLIAKGEVRIYELS
jgi:predicted hotdog family 3-hydroxylacyl-ACP dehydratase